MFVAYVAVKVDMNWYIFIQPQNNNSKICQCCHLLVSKAHLLFLIIVFLITNIYIKIQDKYQYSWSIYVHEI